jgi:hypothetical protein
VGIFTYVRISHSILASINDILIFSNRKKWRQHIFGCLLPRPVAMRTGWLNGCHLSGVPTGKNRLQGNSVICFVELPGNFPRIPMVGLAWRAIVPLSMVSPEAESSETPDFIGTPAIPLEITPDIPTNFSTSILGNPAFPRKPSYPRTAIRGKSICYETPSHRGEP